MRASLTVQRQAVTQDAYGQRNETWSTLLTTRGAVEPLQGREYTNASGEQSEITTRIRLRYSSGASIAPYDRISYDGENYNVRSIIRDPKSRELLLMCTHDGA